MRPNENLIRAWQAYLKVATEATVARLKATTMFKNSASDVELYNRANDLMKKAIRLDKRADVTFRKALKKEYAKRFRIEWKDVYTCQVYVHARYTIEEYVLKFTKSLRLK